MTVDIYEQFEISPETIEEELRPVVCEQRHTDRQTCIHICKPIIIYMLWPTQVIDPRVYICAMYMPASLHEFSLKAYLITGNIIS